MWGILKPPNQTACAWEWRRSYESKWLATRESIRNRSSNWKNHGQYLFTLRSLAKSTIHSWRCRQLHLRSIGVCKRTTAMAAISAVECSFWAACRDGRRKKWPRCAIFVKAGVETSISPSKSLKLTIVKRRLRAIGRKYDFETAAMLTDNSTNLGLEADK